MAAGVGVVALVSVLWLWTGTGGVLLLAAVVFARASVRLSRDDQRQQGQEDFLARRFRNILAPESSCPMPPDYDGWNLIEERDSTGAVVASYVHGANVDEMLMMTRGGTNYFYHADALGSVTHLSDSTGAVVERYAYDVFGSPTIYDSQFTIHAASPVGNRFLFTGREYLAALGLYDYRHRIYMPMIGRFLQTDPIRFDAGDVNLYRYTHNSPTQLVDPNGTKECCGPDVTASFYQALHEAVRRFRRAPLSAQIAGCNRQLWSAQGTTGWDLSFPDGGTGHCAETVSIGGKCYKKWDANYSLFGVLSRLCGSSLGGMDARIGGWKVIKTFLNIGDLIDGGRSTNPLAPPGNPDAIFEWNYSLHGWARYGWSFAGGGMPVQPAGVSGCAQTIKQGSCSLSAWPWY